MPEPQTTWWWTQSRETSLRYVGLPAAENFPGISQFIREIAGFWASGRSLTWRKPLSLQLNLRPVA